MSEEDDLVSEILPDIPPLPPSRDGEVPVGHFLPVRLGSAIINYLGDRPWRESDPYIQQLRALQPIYGDQIPVLFPPPPPPLPAED